MFRWGELSCRLLGSKSSKDRILSQATYSGAVFENEEIEYICCRARFSVFVLSDGRVYTLVNEQRWRGQPELVNGLQEHKIHAVDSGTSHILFVSEAGNVFLSEFQKNKRGANTKLFKTAEPQLLRDFAEICVIQVACGNNHSLALCKDGQVFAWGQNSRGQLGVGKAGRSVPTPRGVTSLAGVPLAQIAAGGSHSFALSVSGAVFAWGSNDHGQLGLNDMENRYHPTEVKLLDGKKMVYISCGGQHTATLTKDGLVFTFGAGRYGQLGHNTTTDELKPQLVEEFVGSKVTQIACGSYHTLVLVATSGKIYSFGRGVEGQLGNGRTSHQSVPRPVTFSMDVPDRVRLAPAMSRGDSEPTVPERRRRVTRAAAAKANTHKRTIAAQDAFPPTGDAAKRMRIGGARGATPKFTKQPVAQATRAQCPTAPSGKYHRRSQLTQGRVPPSPRAKAGMERVTSVMVTDAHPNTQDCPIQPAVRRIFAGANQGFALCIGDTAPVSPEGQSVFTAMKRIAIAEDWLLNKWDATGHGELRENIKQEIDQIFSSAASLNGSFLETSEGNHFKTSSVDPGVDMSAVTLWFEKLGKNPTLLQEVTNAVENKLIPSLSKSPAGVEALRVYLVLPELIDVLMEHTTVVKLTSLLSTAIVSLEESQLEILESWWSHLNEFFFTKLVMLYKSVSYRLLRESSRETKEFPDKLCNCLNIFQRLYKINSTSSLKIQENTFYISPAEVFGGTSISCIAMLQLIPYNCIFNMENKIKIFQRVSHLRMQRGIIVDEKMNFGNSWIIDVSTGNIGVSTGNIGASTGNIDVSTGNIDVSTGNIGASTGNIEASTENTDASTGNIDASTGNIDASTGNIDVSTGNIDASTGNVDASTGNIEASTGNIDASTGNIEASTGNIDASTWNIDASTGNTEASTGNIEASTGNIETSMGNIDVSTGIIEASTRNIDGSTGNTDVSTGIIETSAGNIEASTGNIDVSTGNIEASTGNIDVSTGNIDVSTGNSDVSTGNIDASTGNINASTGNIDASTGNIDVSTGNINASTGNVDVSTGNIDASTGNIDVSTGNIDVSTGNIDASVGNTEASTGIIDVSTGNIDVSTGNIEASTGNIEASTGNIDASNGNIEASTGNIDASTGNTDASTGNIDASTGNIEASIGNIDVSTGNIDASTGNIDASTENIEASTGNIDASTGNIDASTGNIDAFTGHTFDFSDEYDDDDCVDFDFDDVDYDSENVEDLVPTEDDLNFLLTICNLFLPRCFLLINRPDILQNTLAQLRCCSDIRLRGLLQVKFVGESGIDEGGVSQEFFSIITKELCTLPKAFKLYEESRLVWFPEWEPEIADLFRLVGILCWLALYHGLVADFHFPLALYKKLLRVRPTLDDLKELSPTVGQNLQELLNYENDDIEDVFCQDFTVGREMDDGSIVEHELIPNGKNIPVQKHNRRQFVDAYVDYVFNTSVQKHFKAFSEGFRWAVPLPVVDVFLPVELMAVIHGNTKYDWQLLEEHTKYQGYTKADQNIVTFWEMFHELTEDEKKHFLAFLTGCERVPVGGMGSLSITIRREMWEDPDLYFPVAHTCNWTLDLPQYSSGEILRERFLRAIGCCKGFGIA